MKPFCYVYFVVAVTNDEQLGNMVLQTQDVPFILASSSKLRLSGYEHSVNIPISVNKSIIKKGEELLYFVKKAVIVRPPPEVKGLQFESNKKAKV